MGDVPTLRSVVARGATALMRRRDATGRDASWRTSATIELLGATCRVRLELDATHRAGAICRSSTRDASRPTSAAGGAGAKPPPSPTPPLGHAADGDDRRGRSSAVAAHPSKASAPAPRRRLARSGSGATARLPCSSANLVQATGPWNPVANGHHCTVGVLTPAGTSLLLQAFSSFGRDREPPLGTRRYCWSYQKNDAVLRRSGAITSEVRK